jgi:oxygen-independent coproporphyrinogen-3 oxidase
MIEKDQLQFYRFLTRKLIDDDLYPHDSYAEKFSVREVKAIIKGEAPQKLGLYIHIPFCRHKCNYCMCDSYVPQSYQEVKTYLGILKKEIYILKPLFKNVKLTSVYFGGGSPSFLSAYDLEDLFKYIYKGFFLSDRCQIIFEANSTDLNRDKLSVLGRYGVTRLTIGLQSLDKNVIKLINRPQTKKKFIEVFKNARKMGIPYINIDLMAGLEGQSVKSFLSDLKLAISLGADIIHVNGFMPLPHTPFSLQGRKLTLSQIAKREKIILESRKILNKFSGNNSAEDGRGSSEDADNIQETDLRKENSSLIGIGFSAQSHAFGEAWYSHPHSVVRKNKPHRGIPGFWGVRGNLDEEMRKFIVTNFRSGFSFSLFKKLFGKDARTVFMREFSKLSGMNNIKISGDRFYSFFKNRQEAGVFSKLFYSKRRITAIMAKHKKEYDPEHNYQAELDFLICDKE